MNTIDLQNDYKERVLEIWNRFKDIDALNFPGCEYRKSPLLPKTIKKDAILFIGINPAFSKQRNEEIKNKEIEFYPCISDETKDITYFEKFKDIARYCNNAEWTHLDLFFMRETNQKIIDELSYDERGKCFLQAQLDISFDIINRATPKIIIVSNSLASEFFGKRKEPKHSLLKKIWMGYDLNFKTDDFDNELGTYKIKIGEKDTPIFFCGMLSGQRALDLGSLERLKWQIKRILDKKQ
jgi:hypothetical protein